MADCTDTLFYNGFRTWEPGDTITVWRDDWCIGHIVVCHGEFIVTTTLGGLHTVQGIPSPEAAKEAIEKRFREFLANNGLMVEDRPSRKPRGAEIDWGQVVLDGLKEKAKDLMGIRASDRCLKFMKVNAQRMLDMLDTDRRVEVSREAKAFIRELKAKEQREAEEAAAAKAA